MACLVSAGEQLGAHGFKKSMNCAWPWHVKYVARGRGQLKCDGTRAETRFRLSAKRMSPFKSAGASVQLTTGSRGVRISSSSEVLWRVLATHSIRQFPLHFPSRASPCAITFQLDSTVEHRHNCPCPFVLNQWPFGNNDVCWLQCATVTRNYSIGFLSAAWRKFIAFRIFVVGREPAVYRVTQKLLDLDILFKHRVWFDFCAICRFYTGLFEMIVGIICQMQPHVIYFYGVTSRIRFMFLLFLQVSRNWRYESEPPLKHHRWHATNSLERTRLSCLCL